jgi:2',3'-cyclic-nucleotide 2'-phosphodiesterase (5'-nucleotidase family)
MFFLSGKIFPRIWKRLLFLFVLLSLSFVLVAADGSLTILFTHDMHDHLTPSNTLQNGQSMSTYGLTRIASLVKEERKKDSELLLVDAGDYSMGTLFQTIFSTHSPQLRIMGKIGFEATTLGNHEFDFRASGLAKSLNTAKASGDKLPELLVGNVTFPKDAAGNLTPSLAELEAALANYPAKEYILLEKKGYTIALFAVMGKDSASNAPMAEVTFTDYIENARRIVSDIQANETVDMILCLSHSGTEGKSPNTEDEILAKKVPEIDVIISGHSHTVIPEPLIVGKTIIVSCGSYTEKLGKLLVEKTDKAWTVGTYQLIDINDSVPEDREILPIVNYFKLIVEREYLRQYDLGFDEVLAYTPFHFTASNEIGDEHREEPLGTLICDAYRYAVEQAEGDSYEEITAALVPSGVVRGSFVKGDISVADAFIVSSLGIGKDGIAGYPLISVYLTGKELKTMCEVDASIQPIMSAAQLYITGLTYTFNPHRLIFNKVTDVALINKDGIKEKIDDKKLYRVVTGLYSGQMLPVINDKSFGILSVVPKTKDGEVIRDFEAQIIYDLRDGQKKEVKEWVSLAQYLQSFPKIDGKSIVSNYYAQAQGLKNVDASKNIFKIIASPNLISLIVYAIVIIISILIVWIFVVIIKRIHRRKNE